MRFRGAVGGFTFAVVAGAVGGVGGTVGVGVVRVAGVAGVAVIAMVPVSVVGVLTVVVIARRAIGIARVGATATVTVTVAGRGRAGRRERVGGGLCALRFARFGLEIRFVLLLLLLLLLLGFCHEAVASRIVGARHTDDGVG